MHPNIENVDSPCHGTMHGYGGHGCRCDFCRDANNRYNTELRRDRTRRLRTDPTLAVHGKASTYRNWGCRCAVCFYAHSAKCRAERARREARAAKV